MMIKIDCDGWSMYDGFEKIRYERISHEQAKAMDTDACWFQKNTGTPDVLLIIGRKKSGEEYSIKTSSPTYILNDEGKTIERIN